MGRRHLTIKPARLVIRDPIVAKFLLSNPVMTPRVAADHILVTHGGRLFVWPVVDGARRSA
jgi:hypothetical protein